MSYRDDVDALAARHTVLEHELAEKTREVAASASRLEEAREQRRLPVLENIRVAAPCKASWDKMVGDERVRHCGDCNKDVFHLSGMTRAEAEALIAEKTGHLCVRYFQRADGTILTTDCSVGGSKRRRRRIVAAGAAMMLAGGVATAFRGVTMMGAPMRDPHVMGGAVAMPEQPQPLPASEPTEKLGESSDITAPTPNAEPPTPPALMQGQMSVPAHPATPAHTAHTAPKSRR